MQFLNQNSKWVRGVLILFVVGIILGATTAIYYPELMQEIIDEFSQRFGENPQLDSNLAVQIFLQNLGVATMAWIGGLLTVALAPAFIVLANGFIMGYVVSYVIANSADALFSIYFLTVGLVPHGILEIPAFLAAAVLGSRLGLEWLSKNSKGARLVILKQSFGYTFKMFFYVVVALALAAVIEVFISGKLVDKL